MVLTLISTSFQLCLFRLSESTKAFTQTLYQLDLLVLGEKISIALYSFGSLSLEITRLSMSLVTSCMEGLLWFNFGFKAH